MSRPIVSTRSGKIQGVLKKTCFGRPFNAFYAIPYAEQPTETLRFRDPIPLKGPWKNVLDATKMSYRDVCLQFDPFIHPTEAIGSDECLKLHVYSCDLRPVVPKPVVVFIYGGTFHTGSGTMYGPDYLLQHNVVVVSISYRTAPFGFLALPDAGIPGNAGLKDQLLALKWIKEHILAFGGNPENVTLLGHGAGATSAHCHLLAPASKDLFHKAILSSFSHWPQPNSTLSYANVLGYKGCGSDEDLLDFFEKIDPRELVRHAGQNTMIQPVIDGTFITKPIAEMAKNAWGNRLNVIFGICSMESLIHHRSACDLDQNLLFANLLPANESMAVKLEKVKQLQEIYANETSNAAKNILAVLHDRCYVHGIYRTIRSRQGTTGKTWLYHFSVEPRAPKYDMVRRIFKIPHKRMANHMEDLLYIFRSKALPIPQKDSEEYRIMLSMTTFYTNFAKTGEPGKRIWRPLDRDCKVPRCLSIRNESDEFIVLPRLAQARVWYKLCQRKTFWDGVKESLPALKFYCAVGCAAVGTVIYSVSAITKHSSKKLW